MSYMDYEEMILARQESEADDCTDCEYKGNCHNQCMEINYIYNPNLNRRNNHEYTKKKNNNQTLLQQKKLQ